MNILLTGATGYLGKKLLPVLINDGHRVTCCVRDASRFVYPDNIEENVSVAEIDFLEPPEEFLPGQRFDAAYYLIHSMGSTIDDFEDLERQTAENFVAIADQLGIKQVIYLGGFDNNEKLSKHLSSRKKVGVVLSKGKFQLTMLKAGIIVGSGSASFEIIRDLVEKLPVMITPKWVLTKTQPIAVRDVIKFLTGVLMHPECMGKTFDIAGPDVLSYKEMLLLFAKVRQLKRRIFTIPVMTPRLSSYWLYFVTSTSYKLAVNLVNSMKVEVLSESDELKHILQIEPLGYEESIALAFERIEQNEVFSSWKDALSSSSSKGDLLNHVKVPEYGCFKDKTQLNFSRPTDEVIANIWSIGGNKGWYYATWLWNIRGLLDKMAGGVGLRRGRTNETKIHAGDSLDFWRVLLADKKKGKLLLFAEMKLPGEAWLEFNVTSDNCLTQTATFRPRGLWGRIYWYMTKPFHLFIFKGMATRIINAKARR